MNARRENRDKRRAEREETGDEKRRYERSERNAEQRVWLRQELRATSFAVSVNEHSLVQDSIRCFRMCGYSYFLIDGICIPM